MPRERVVLHCDLNNFYASVECALNPELRNRPIVVGGDAEARHGIVLAKNELAKATGIKTAETLWQARQKCPKMLVVPPHFEKYQQVAYAARAIYTDYTDQVEPFGMDEAWLDVGGTGDGDGKRMADEIRARIWRELEITASVGVSFNKVFAKLGSDMKKPDATTVVSRDNFRQRVWPLPVGDLLYIGPSMQRKLALRGISTIGELAGIDKGVLRAMFGKWGETMSVYANGEDEEPVRCAGATSAPKSIGNSTTTRRDLENDEDVKKIFYVLAESVSAQLREQGYRCRTIQISMRDNEMKTCERQGKLAQPTFLTGEMVATAMHLFHVGYHWQKPLRSIGIRGSDLVAVGNEQLSFFEDAVRRGKMEQLETAIDSLRNRFGSRCVQRAVLQTDPSLGMTSPKDDPARDRKRFNSFPTARD